jgi:hypothetical protein
MMHHSSPRLTEEEIKKREQFKKRYEEWKKSYCKLIGELLEIVAKILDDMPISAAYLAISEKYQQLRRGERYSNELFTIFKTVQVCILGLEPTQENLRKLHDIHELSIAIFKHTRKYTDLISSQNYHKVIEIENNNNMMLEKLKKGESLTNIVLQNVEPEIDCCTIC